MSDPGSRVNYADFTRWTPWEAGFATVPDCQSPLRRALPRRPLTTPPPQHRAPRQHRRPLALAIAGLFALPGIVFAQSSTLKAERILHVPPVKDDGAIFLRADSVSGTMDEQVEAQGNVELRTRARRMTAEYMRYDMDNDELFASGDVHMRNRQNEISGPEMFYRRESATGYFHSPTVTIGANNSRSDARELDFLGEDQYQLYDGHYTTCPATDNAWYLRVSDMKIDQARSVGTAHNATIYFKDVPILWAPWIDFPLDNKRKSGFLTPAFGSSGNRGFETALPYYWNIAPNYDATFVPRLMTKRGLQLNGQFRYLRPDMNGLLDAEYLPHDRVTDSNRYQFAWHHNEVFTPHLTGALNLNKVSDDTYFTDLADRIAVTSQTTLPREGSLTYSLPGMAVIARIQRFQTLQDPTAPPITPPYERLPQVVANGVQRDFHGFDLTFLGEYDRFSHPTMITGERFVAYPSFSFPLRGSYWFVTPKTGLNYADYRIDENSGNPEDTTRALFHSGTRSVPITSLDGGLIFERDWTVFGKAFLNTLEPRMYFLYVPFRKQDQFPIFDSALADFNFAQLFSENRYVGQDRIGDAKQVTLAVTSRLLEPDTGDERLRVALGQRYYFNNQEVTLNEPLRTDRRSDYLVALAGRITDRWLLEADLQYNPNQHETEQLNYAVRYQPASGKVLSLGYRFQRDVLDTNGLPTQIKQWDISGQWPLFQNWYLEARWNYSTFDRKLLEAVAGLEYNGGCWVFRFLGQRIATTTTGFSNSVFFQLELNGLGRLGTNPLEVLRRNIPGYYKFNDTTITREVPNQWYEPK
jgi:LPS-assembly protein